MGGSRPLALSKSLEGEECERHERRYRNDRVGLLPQLYLLRCSESSGSLHEAIPTVAAICDNGHRLLHSYH